MGGGGGGVSISSPKRELKAQTKREEGAEGINSLSIKEGCGGVSLRGGGGASNLHRADGEGGVVVVGAGGVGGQISTLISCHQG